MCLKTSFFDYNVSHVHIEKGTKNSKKKIIQTNYSLLK